MDPSYHYVVPAPWIGTQTLRKWPELQCTYSGLTANWSARSPPARIDLISPAWDVRSLLPGRRYDELHLNLILPRASPPTSTPDIIPSRRDTALDHALNWCSPSNSIIVNSNLSCFTISRLQRRGQNSDRPPQLFSLAPPVAYRLYSLPPVRLIRSNVSLVLTVLHPQHIYHHYPAA